jgi:hypothetical protein
VEDLVVERIRVARRLILVDRHRRVVGEVRIVQHLEHLVSADLQRTVNLRKTKKGDESRR